MQMALRMSLEEAGQAPSPAPAPAPSGTTAPAATTTTTATTGDAPQFMDPEFVRQLLGSFQGVDPSHPSIRAALEQVGLQQGVGEEKKGDGKDDKEDKEGKK